MVMHNNPVFIVFVGSYIYLEISDIPTGSQAILQSPSFAASGGACFSFYYHMFGQHIGTLVLRASNSGSLLWSLSGAQRE